MFHITRGTGFKITFDNGYTVSVQFGPHTYSDNRYGEFSLVVPDSYLSKTAEVAIMHDDQFVRIEGAHDDVFGYVMSEQVADVLAAAARGNLSDIAEILLTD